MDGIADYEFVRPLGEGNHGTYYLAIRPERLPVEVEYVAVKVLGGATSADVFRHTTRELAAFAAVSSPYLVTLFDAGQQDGVLFYSMEYLPGGSLANPVKPLDTAGVLRAVAHAALAAHHLHEAGIVHRDVKPGNILLHDDGAKLSDLGLSQVLAPGITLTGMGPVGSVQFVDPGQLRGDPPSRASDVWSLGATLHWALTGQGLYGELPENDPLLALRRVLSTPPTPANGLPDEAGALIREALAPAVTGRPATALEFAERLEAQY